MTAALASPANTPLVPALAGRQALTPRVLLIWAVVCGLFFATKGQAILTRAFPDPDDALRLLEVRDLLAGQSWFDVHQYRIAAPEGVAMHWSRLVDIPLALVILALRPLLGQPMAELVACVAVPLLTLLALMALIARLAARRLNVEIAGMACLFVALSVPAMFQFQPLRIDHHAWQVVCILAALNGLAARDGRKGGIVIGVALSAWLAISVEGLPLTAAFLGLLALRFLLDRRAGNALAIAAGTLAAASTALFLATRGLGDLEPHCDAVSPAHLAGFAVCAAGMALLPRLARRPAPVIVGAGLAGVALAAGTFIALAPQCRQGAFAALDPLVRRFWYDNVLEGQPLWHLSFLELTFLIAPALVGLIGALRLWHTARGADERRWWWEYALLLAAAIVIGVLVTRAAATASLIGAIGGAWLFRDRVDAATAHRNRPLRRLAGFALLPLIVFPGLVAMAAQPLLERYRPSAAAVPQTPSHCDFAKLATALDRLPATDIFAPMDIGPRLLVDTPHRVVATGHHRNVAGIHDVIAAFIASPDDARAIIHRRHTSLIVLCPDENEVATYRAQAPAGLMARLVAGKPPAWLQPADLAPGSGFRIWRVE